MVVAWHGQHEEQQQQQRRKNTDCDTKHAGRGFLRQYVVRCTLALCDLLDHAFFRHSSYV